MPDLPAAETKTEFQVGQYSSGHLDNNLEAGCIYCVAFSVKRTSLFLIAVDNYSGLRFAFPDALLLRKPLSIDSTNVSSMVMLFHTVLCLT